MGSQYLISGGLGNLYKEEEEEEEGITSPAVYDYGVERGRPGEPEVSRCLSVWMDGWMDGWQMNYDRRFPCAR